MDVVFPLIGWLIEGSAHSTTVLIEDDNQYTKPGLLFSQKDNMVLIWLTMASEGQDIHEYPNAYIYI